MRWHRLTPAIFAFSACDVVPPTDLSEPDPAGLQAAAAVYFQPIFGPSERLMDEISSEYPAFAGFYYDSNTDYLVIRSTDPAQGAAAGARVETSLAGNGRPPRPVRIDPATFTFRQLADWRHVFRQSLPEGVYSIDLDQRANVLHFGVRSDAVGRELRSVARHSGIPIAAVTTQVVEPPAFRGDLQDQWRPAPGGVQITWGSGNQLCTLGIPARWLGSTNYTGFLTASHCGNIPYESENTWYYQNDYAIANLIGSEFDDPKYWSGSPCASGRVCRWTDISFVRAGSSSDIAFAEIARPSGSPAYGGPGPDSFYGVTFDQVQEYDAIQGDKLHKVGQTSGWTYGYVTADCVDHDSGFNKQVSGVWHDLWILCSDDTDIYSEPGDSGAPIFLWWDESVNIIHVAGILWGGPEYNWNVTWYSPLSGMSYDGLTSYATY